MKNVRIVIHVEGGLVQSIYKAGDDVSVEIEVVDLDAPICETDEESAAFDDAHEYIDSIEKDPTYTCIY